MNPAGSPPGGWGARTASMAPSTSRARARRCWCSAARAGTDERPIVRVDRVDSREAVEALRGADLLVPRSAAPALGEDEYWPEDLEGCAVTDGDVAVGVVKQLIGYPSVDVLEVERPDGADLLVPMVRDAIRSVDVAARRIDVSLEFLGD
jgi:16S rRNA processing protein RimM